MCVAAAAPHEDDDDDEMNEQIRDVSLADIPLEIMDPEGFQPFEIADDDSTQKASSLSATSLETEEEDADTEEEARQKIIQMKERIGTLSSELIQEQANLERYMMDRIRYKEARARRLSMRARPRKSAAKLPAPGVFVESTKDWARKFIAENKKTVARIILQAHRYMGEEVLQCPHDEKRNKSFIPPDIRVQYNLPRGIIGTSPRFKRQAFMICFKGTHISGPMIDLGAGETTFEDPRDCAEVLRKLDLLFRDYETLHRYS
jgi:hypothetical protein